MGDFPPKHSLGGQCIYSSLLVLALCRFVPAHGMLIARVLVTPTRIVCLPPEVELSNRVVRHFQ